MRQARAEEETGFKAKKIKKLVSFWPTPRVLERNPARLRGFRPGGIEEVSCDDEFIEHAVFPFDEALKKAMNGKIKDSKTIIALLYWAGHTKTIDCSLWSVV